MSDMGNTFKNTGGRNRYSGSIRVLMVEYRKPELSELGDIEEVTESGNRGSPDGSEFSSCSRNNDGKNPNC